MEYKLMDGRLLLSSMGNILTFIYPLPLLNPEAGVFGESPFLSPTLPFISFFNSLFLSPSSVILWSAFWLWKLPVYSLHSAVILSSQLGIRVKGCWLNSGHQCSPNQFHKIPLFMCGYSDFELLTQWVLVYRKYPLLSKFLLFMNGASIALGSILWIQWKTELQGFI